MHRHPRRALGDGDQKTDPQLVSAGSDYHLQGSSPAIDRGASWLAVDHDVEGTPRPSGNGFDIGAYEYGGGPGAGNGGGAIHGIGGKCLDDNASGTDDGNKIQLWDCNGTGAQTWRWSGQALVGPGGKCLDVQWGNQASGTPVQLWDCNGSAAQAWSYDAGRGAVVSAGGLCLDANGGSTDNGTQLQIWACWGGANQRWTNPSP